MPLEKIRSFLFKNSSTKQTVARNALWRFFALGFSKVIRLVVLLVVARWLGPNEFGIYNYILSIATFTFIFSDWGLNLLFTRDSQQRPEDTERIFSAALLTKIITSTASILITCIAAITIKDIQTLPLLLIAVTFLFGNIRELYVSSMIAKQRGELEALSSIIEGLANLAALFLILYGMRTALGFSVFNLFVTLVGLWASIWIVKSHLKIRLTRPLNADLLNLVRNGFPLALLGIAGYLFFSADQLFVKYFLGTEAVGYYALATRPAYAAMLIPGLIVSVIFPVLSRITRDTIQLKKMLITGTILLMLAGTICTALIIVCRPLILIAAPQYGASLPIMAKLSWILVFMFPSLWLDNVLIALNKQKQDFYFTLCAAALNIALNILWIPRYGLSGAAYASILAQGINMTITFLYAQSLLNRRQGMTILSTSNPINTNLPE